MMLLVLWMIINAIDFAVIFLLAHAIVKKKPVLTVKWILIGIAYAVALGMVSFIFEDSYNYRYIYRIITIVLDILIVYFIVRKSLSSALLAYALLWSFISVIQLPLIIIFELIGLAEPPQFMVVQLLTLVCAFVAYKLLPFNNWFRFMEEQLELKLMFLTLGATCLIAAFYLNFEYDIPYLWQWVGMFIVVLVIIYQISARIIHRRHTIPLENNDAYHTTLGLLVKAYQEEDDSQVEALKKELRSNHNVHYDFDCFQLGKTAENIIAFIDVKQNNVNSEIKHYIRYRQDHPRIGIDIIIKLLSILLDNAIESETSRPIVVDLGVNESHVQLSVRNEFKLKDPEGISRILTIDGYTTKKINQRGYGLTNLHMKLKQIGGELTTSYNYNPDGKAYYLSMMVNIIG